MDFQDNSSGGMSDADVSALIEQVNAPDPERPMTGGDTPPQEAQTATATPPQQTAQPQQNAWDPKPWEFTWKGQKILPENQDKLKQWAAQGYDYAQRMELLKQERENYKTELEKKFEPYKKYDEINQYVQKDPEWWAHVEQSWNDRLQSEDPTIRRVKSLLEQELAPVKEILTQKEQEAQQARISEEDQRLSQDIKSIREKYADLDFDTPDADGKSLEHKVIEYGAKNNIPTFKAAFLDFYHDQLEKMWEARGREAISKDAAKRQKLGLSGKPQTPKAKTDDYDVRGKSHNDLLNEILEREGIA
jgi:hypothetical protein